jgi:hypothetical protein
MEKCNYTTKEITDGRDKKVEERVGDIIVSSLITICPI